MSPGLGPVLVQVAAFWPVWPWLLARGLDPSDEGQGWLALAALALAATRAPTSPDREPDLRPAAALTLAYALAHPFAPPLARALLASLALAAALLGLRPGLAPRLAALTLAALALPILPSLQFFLGYPLRVASGELAALALRATGLTVRREGTLLAWKERLVMIDAPCSGASMLWGALFLAAALALAGALRESRAALLLGVAVGATVAANGLRAALAFLVEAPVLPAPPGAHDALGPAVFGCLALVLVLVQRCLVEDPP